MKKKVKRFLGKRSLKMRTPSISRLRKKRPEESLKQAIQGIPRITNETVAEHREEVLSSARKYIYPLQHSAHRVVIISTTLAMLLIIGFITYSIIELYQFQATSSFFYRITQVVPF